jgi:hypothetical protein
LSFFSNNNDRDGAADEGAFGEDRDRWSNLRSRTAGSRHPDGDRDYGDDAPDRLAAGKKVGLAPEEEEEEEKPRAKSCAELAGINNAIYASASLWDLQGSASTSVLFSYNAAAAAACNNYNDNNNNICNCNEPEYTYEQILSAQSDGSTNLDNEGCLLVYGCPKDLVPLLKPDVVDDRRRRWVLRMDYIEAINYK